MMAKCVKTTAVIALGMAAVVVMVRADEEKIALNKVPAAVMKAVKAKFRGAEVKGAAQEVEGGKTTYEIMISHDGHNIDASVKPDGTIEAIEKEIKIKELPEAVSKAMKAKYPHATLKKAEQLTEGEKETYEVVVAISGKKDFEVVLDPRGKIIEDGGQVKN